MWVYKKTHKKQEIKKKGGEIFWLGVCVCVRALLVLLRSGASRRHVLIKSSRVPCFIYFVSSGVCTSMAERERAEWSHLLR